MEADISRLTRRAKKSTFAAHYSSVESADRSGLPRNATNGVIIDAILHLTLVLNKCAEPTPGAREIHHQQLIGQWLPTSAL